MSEKKELEEKYVAALDVGSTTIRCQIVNSKGETITQASTNVKVIHPKPGYVEIEPDSLWSDVVYVVKRAIKDAGLNVTDVACLGIGTQRATFLTWRRDTGEPFHNFITWSDLRSKSLVDEWNDSAKMRAFRTGTYLLYLVTGSQWFRAGSLFKFSTSHVTLKLQWVLDNIPEVHEELAKDNVLFGTVETWLLYKLTSGRRHLTDHTNASTTGLVDPFSLDWVFWVKSVMRIPTQIFPRMVTNDHDFGVVDAAHFGAPLPVGCVIADQQASMYGSCCFSFDTLKVTLGTGAFLDLPVRRPVSTEAVYPVVLSTVGKETLYMVEGSCNDTGTLVQWALQAGLCDNPSDSDRMASSVDDTDGVYFVPAFGGLGPPIYDHKAASGFVGVKRTSRREHMMRALLESIVFRVKLQVDMLKADVYSGIAKIVVDGGVSNNNFVCQMLADITGLKVERPTTTEMSCLGVAFVAGLNCGIWKSKDELKALRKVDRTFAPTEDQKVKNYCQEQLEHWQMAVERFKRWYK